MDYKENDITGNTNLRSLTFKNNVMVFAKWHTSQSDMIPCEVMALPFNKMQQLYNINDYNNVN